jgi:predicted ferric reductase
MMARAAFWSGTYLALVLLPLLAALIAGPSAGGRPFGAAVGIACGFVALALLVLELGLVARFRAASRPFGTDALMHFHRLMGLSAVAFLLAHVVLLWGSRAGRPFHAAALAVVMTLLLVGTSLARRQLRLPYEAWQQLHGLGACVIVASAIVHVLADGRHARDPVVGGLVLGYGALFLALFLGYRVLRPLRLWRRPWTVVDGADAGGDTWLVRVAPAGPWRLAFEPGQFAWMITGRTPFSLQQHPLSMASSAEATTDGIVEFAIKALGDWSGSVPRRLVPGTRLWLDGPYGAFTPDRVPGQGFVLVAGGIGVTPMRSIIRTLRDRGDPRPVLLILAAHDPSRVVFRDELAALERVMALRVVEVFEAPPAGWTGERGLVTAALLRRHLPPHAERHQYFVCGPPPMMDAVERAFAALGIPPGRIHTERFDVV